MDDTACSGAVPVDGSSYPGGKSGAGVYQRFINWIPKHRVFVSAFAGKCGITRNILPAEHTIVIDADESVCQWWDDWCRTPEGRSLEIHHCDAIQWLQFNYGGTLYPASRAAPPRVGVLDAFVFCDPPYVLSKRSGPRYRHEMTDSDHVELLSVVGRLGAYAMLCGYPSDLYAALDPRRWRSIDRQVPTRRGLQDERVWLNYPRPEELHDSRYVGNTRRDRERNRRRQRSWLSQLAAMGDRERQAMLSALEKGNE